MGVRTIIKKTNKQKQGSLNQKVTFTKSLKGKKELAGARALQTVRIASIKDLWLKVN